MSGEATIGGDGRKLFGVLVTYRRPSELAETLSLLEEQDRRLDSLVVVDNGADPSTETVVRSSSRPTEYLPTPENLGFAGGVAVGMERVLTIAHDEDWIVLIDDDDPPPFADALAALERFASTMVEQDGHTAAVGLHGSRWDWRKGRVKRVSDAELSGPVAVDYVGGNSLPFYRVGPLREVGVFSRDIFFGLSEVEHGLRLRRAGYTAYAHGDLWRKTRTMAGRMGYVARPSVRLRKSDWRQYYSLRNTIHILRAHGKTLSALRVSALVGLLKPVLNLPIAPRTAWRQLQLQSKAVGDGWRGRMGRTVEPEPWGRRPTKPRKTEAAGETSS